MRNVAQYVRVAVLCLIFSLCCAGAAYAYDIQEGGTYSLSDMGPVVYINTAEAVTLTGKLSGSVECTVDGVSLTLNSVDVTAAEGCALSFTGHCNTLILEGSNTVQSGDGCPGVRAEIGTELTIEGDGSLTATGGDGGAGIGGGEGWISITGGTVIAIGGSDAAGIGGSRNADSCETTISGDALVYASRGETGDAFDIGAGDGGNNTMTFTIKGKAAVFFGSGLCDQPSAKNHAYKTPDDEEYPMIAQGGADTAAIYGIEGTGDSPWIDAKGGYFMLFYMRYDLNGGQGDLSQAQRALHMTASVTVADGEGLQRSKYLFTGWNTEAGGSRAVYMPGDRLTCSVMSMQITLYAQWKSAGDNDIYAGGEYNLSKMKAPVTINTTESVTLTGKLSGTIACTVEGVKLTLSGVTATTREGCALSFTGAGNILVLEGESTVKSGGRDPGIRVERGTELTIRGDGSLKATGGSNGAGIGGGDCAESGTITIESGEITATGAGNGAGIGGGSCRDAGTIIINGGTVEATGGEDGGAGIGGSSDNGYDKILITGGTITASCGEHGGKGIGQGWNSAKIIPGGEITITGGTVTANGGIGGGGWNSGGVITIEGGTILSNGSIGGGSVCDIQGKDEGRITISGGTIVANGGIGRWSDIVITGGDITASGTDAGAGIDAGVLTGDIADSDLKSITITGGTIVAIGGRGAAGIGSGSMKFIGTITITGGDITATGGEPFVNTGAGWDNMRFGGGAGIGSGCSSRVDNIIISGGTIRANGAEEGAGIGTGESGRGNEITISGGTVVATGGDYAAGIGGGKNSDSVKTTICGGDSLVYAQKGDGAHYDIGAGDGGQNMTKCLYIQGNAAVFLGTNISATPVAKSHTKKRPGNKTDPMVVENYNGALTVYGIAGTGKSPWAEAQGGYFVLCSVCYDANGGNGDAPESTGPVHITVPVLAAGADGLSKEGYAFTCWNTQANLRGRTYFPGDVIVFSESQRELTLYAQWDKNGD